MKDLDKSIKKYYESKSLSSVQLEKILNVSTQSKRPNYKYLIAASIILGLLLTSIVHPLYNKNKIINAYAKEITYNHLKQSPSKIITDDVQIIKDSLSKLNFQLENNSKLKSFGKLTGAKYCHIDDQIAAQLRIVNSKNESLTCYQFKQQYDYQFNKVISFDSINVHLWTQDSIVFGIAETKNSN